MDEYYPVDHSTELFSSNNWFKQWVISENIIEDYSGKTWLEGQEYCHVHFARVILHIGPANECFHQDKCIYSEKNNWALTKL